VGNHHSPTGFASSPRAASLGTRVTSARCRAWSQHERGSERSFGIVSQATRQRRVRLLRRGGPSARADVVQECSSNVVVARAFPPTPAGDASRWDCPRKTSAPAAVLENNVQRLVAETRRDGVTKPAGKGKCFSFRFFLMTFFRAPTRRGYGGGFAVHEADVTSCSGSRRPAPAWLRSSGSSRSAAVSPMATNPPALLNVPAGRMRRRRVAGDF